jgi:hypothetical protein
MMGRSIFISIFNFGGVRANYDLVQTLCSSQSSRTSTNDKDVDIAVILISVMILFSLFLEGGEGIHISHLVGIVRVGYLGHKIGECWDGTKMSCRCTALCSMLYAEELGNLYRTKGVEIRK